MEPRSRTRSQAWYSLASEVWRRSSAWCWSPVSRYAVRRSRPWRAWRYAVKSASLSAIAAPISATITRHRREWAPDGCNSCVIRLAGPMHQVKGVVARGKGQPVEVVTINVPDPGPGEALVQVQACGVCHTDLHYREGGINDDFPFLLGHEAAGIVEAVGPDVTGLAPGDFVVLNWRAVCGDCRACNRGEPWYCFATHNATQKMTLQDGTELSPALGIGAFAEKTLVAAGQCTKVDPSARPAAVGLLGCGVMAGMG